MPVTVGPAEQSPVVLGAAAVVDTPPVTVDAHGLALTVIATVALLFALQWAQTFCLALLLGIFLAYGRMALT